MPAPTTTGGGLMGYASTVDSGGVMPLSLYSGNPASGTSSALAANTVYFVSLSPLLAGCTLTSVRVRFGTGGSGHYDVGIYDSTGTSGNPGNLLAHAASTNTALATATGIQSPSFTGGNVPLAPGNYWLALWVDNATDTVTKIAIPAAGQMPVLNMSSSGPLPSTASGLSNATQMPNLFGLLLNGWS